MYHTAFKYILNPLYERLVKKRHILQHQRFLMKSQWWSRDQMEAFQLQELKKLLRIAYHESDWWHQRLTNAGLSHEITSLRELTQLPVMTKADIRNHKENMIPSSWKGRTWTKSTGGSTGIPLELDYTPDSYDWRFACTHRGYSWAGCEDGRKQVYIWGSAIGKVSEKQKKKEDLHNAFLRRKVFNCFQFTDEVMADCLNTLNTFKPDSIVGYTNPLYNFARFIGTPDKIHFRAKGIISAAEKLHEHQREYIQSIFQCPVYNTYGSREFMLIASEQAPGQGLLVNAENLIVEILREDNTPCAPGDMGRIVITDLHNYGMPFIRYEIGDMGILTDEHATCGRGLPILKDVVGRSLDMLRTPDGRHIPGEFFPHLMKEFKELRQFQVIQKSLDTLVIKLVEETPLSESALQFMKEEIFKVTGPSITIDFKHVKDIPLTQTGKHRVTISEIKLS